MHEIQKTKFGNWKIIKLAPLHFIYRGMKILGLGKGGGYEIMGVQFARTLSGVKAVVNLKCEIESIESYMTDEEVQLLIDKFNQ